MLENDRANETIFKDMGKNLKEQASRYNQMTGNIVSISKEFKEMSNILSSILDFEKKNLNTVNRNRTDAMLKIE
jgi:hypothetical protein